jgi:alkylation response protein AidB-like acyl-CoA dehydrogenase
MAITTRDAQRATPTPATAPLRADARLDAATAQHWTGADASSAWLQAAEDLVPLLAADADEVDARGQFAAEGFAALREQRFMSMLVPEALGGGGASFAETCAVLAELARGCGSTSLALSMHSHLVAAQVWRHHRQLPAPVLAKVAADELVLVSTGASDWIDSSGVARRVDGGFRLTGRKTPASGAPAGHICVTSARWDDGPDGPQVVHASVPFGADGVSIDETWDATGMRGTGSHTVVFDDVFVPDAAVPLIRPAGAWHPVWSTVLGVALPLIMSTYVGVADRATELALDLVRRRSRPPEAAGVVGRMLTQRTVARDAVRAMIDAADDLHFDNDLEHASAVLMRKTIATDAAIETVRLALEVGGGSAYASGSGIGRLLRDVHGALYHPLPAARQERFSGQVALGLDPLG